MLLFLIKTLSKVFLFNLAQFSLVTDDPGQLVLEKCTCYVHLEHYIPKNMTQINFTKNDMYFCFTRICHSCVQKWAKVNSVTSIMAYWRNVNICRWHGTSPQACAHFCNKHNQNISSMWADQYFKNTLRLKFWNIVKVTSVLAGTLKISVNSKCYNPVAELINRFPLPKLSDM